MVNFEWKTRVLQLPETVWVWFVTDIWFLVYIYLYNNKYVAG